MPIIQVNTWICENCGAVEAEAREVGAYDDPCVCTPYDHPWDFVKASTAPWEEILCCPACAAKFKRGQASSNP